MRDFMLFLQTHHTKGTASDPSHEGIDDTLVSVAVLVRLRSLGDHRLLGCYNRGMTGQMQGDALLCADIARRKNRSVHHDERRSTDDSSWLPAGRICR